MKTRYSLVVLFVVAGMLLAACGGAATPAAAPTQPPAAAPTQPPAVAPTEPPAAAPTEPPAAEAVKLTLWSTETGAAQDEVKSFVAECAKADPSYTVDVVFFDTEKQRENFQTSALAGTGPDMLWGPNDHAGPFTTADLIEPVDNLGIDLGQFAPGALEPVALNGQHWAIPMQFGNHLMLLYNKKLIEKAPADTAELIKMAQDFQAKNPGSVGLAWNFPEPFWLVPWLGGFGGKVFADDGKTPTLNTPEMVKALALVSELKNTDKITPQECDYACADGLFKDGKAAMILNGDWSLGDYTGSTANVTATQNIDLGTAPFPKIAGADYPRPYTAGKYLFFPKGAAPEKQAAAVKLAQCLVSEPIQLRQIKEQKRLPSIQKLFDDPLIKSDVIMAGSAADLLNGTGMPAATEMRCNWDAMKPNLSDVLTGKATPEDAAAAMQVAAEKCVKDLQ